ncbi:hypothetical protein B4U80_12834 [Leptotrombidium deliense]|uniref:Caspase family p20 domain-containing protein n=1 Tax=Leptotrombidium deliense TaxID=299467 RepID=A0A443SJZ4_9ACAR|nr:hypothetical protein B4U80_12834 [Leptotrombidium deliense]
MFSSATLSEVYGFSQELYAPIQFVGEMQELLKEKLADRNLINNTIIGLYSNPYYLTIDINFNYNIDIKFLRHLQQLRDCQATKLTGIDTEELIYDKSTKPLKNYCELFKFLLNDEMCANYQTPNDVHVNFNFKEKLDKAYVGIVLNYTDLPSTPRIRNLNVADEQIHVFHLFQLPYSQVTTEVSKILSNISPIIQQINIIIVGHGYYDNARKENYMIGHEKERIYPNDVMVMYDKCEHDFIRSIAKHVNFYACDFYDFGEQHVICRIMYDEEEKETNDFNHVFGARYSIEPFMRNIDIEFYYHDISFFEFTKIHNRRANYDCNALCLEFHNSEIEMENYIEFRLYRDDHVKISETRSYTLTSISDILNVIHSATENWNDKEVLFLNIRVNGYVHNAKFNLWFGSDIFDLNCFLRELLLRNCQLEFSPKIIHVHVILLQNEYEQVHNNLNLRGQRINVSRYGDSLQDISSISDMLFIWSTCSGYANHMMLDTGSNLSFNIAQTLRISHSQQRNFQPLLIFLGTTLNECPLEYTDLNIGKAIVFGNHELSEKCYKLNGDVNGYCIIINNQKFPQQFRQKYLTHITVKNYSEAFKRQNFECKIFNDLTCSQMWQCLIDVSLDKTLLTHNALVIIIVSISEAIDNVDVIYGIDGDYITVSALKLLFTDQSCEALKDKLKLFIVDGPRGECVNDYRNKQQIDLCENFSKVIDTRLHFMTDKLEDYLFQFNTPFGKLTHLNDFKVVSSLYKFEFYYFKQVLENGKKFLKIFVAHQNQQYDTCVAILDDFSEYDEISFWEKTRKENTLEECKVLLNSNAYCRSPKVEMLESARCFCDL